MNCPIATPALVSCGLVAAAGTARPAATLRGREAKVVYTVISGLCTCFLAVFSSSKLPEFGTIQKEDFSSHQTRGTCMTY
jgi:hypothetical protein